MCSHCRRVSFTSVVTTKHSAYTIVRMFHSHSRCEAFIRRAKSAHQHCLRPTSPVTKLHIALHLDMQPLHPSQVPLGTRLQCSLVGFTSPLFCHISFAAAAVCCRGQSSASAVCFCDPEACGKSRGLASAPHINCFWPSAAGLQSCRMRSVLARCTYADHIP